MNISGPLRLSWVGTVSLGLELIWKAILVFVTNYIGAGLILLFTGKDL
jgi:hypothetical protein